MHISLWVCKGQKKTGSENFPKCMRLKKSCQIAPRRQQSHQRRTSSWGEPDPHWATSACRLPSEGQGKDCIWTMNCKAGEDMGQQEHQWSPMGTQKDRARWAVRWILQLLAHNASYSTELWSALFLKPRDSYTDFPLPVSTLALQCVWGLYQYL